MITKGKTMRIRGLAVTVLLAGLAVQPAVAEEFEVKMLNKGEEGAMVFEPDLVQAQVGDTVKFLVVDKGHNAETIKGMIPEGAEPVIGGMDEELVITLTEEGVYGIRCKPHYGLGMVALILAGDPVNLEAVQEVKTPGKARKKFEALFAEVTAE